MKTILIIKSSLSPDSLSAKLADNAIKMLKKEKSIAIEVLDLREIKLEFCDGRDLEEYNEDMQKAHKQIEDADGYLIAMPVYSYSMSGVLKNFLDICCEGMSQKPFGLLIGSGGQRGTYAAAADVSKVLMYEATAFPIPCKPANVSDEKEITSTDIQKRLQNIVAGLIRYI